MIAAVVEIAVLVWDAMLVFGPRVFPCQEALSCLKSIAGKLDIAAINGRAPPQLSASASGRCFAK